MVADLREQRRLAAGDPLRVRLAAEVPVEHEQDRPQPIRQLDRIDDSNGHFVTYGNEIDARPRWRHELRRRLWPGPSRRHAHQDDVYGRAAALA